MTQLGPTGCFLSPTRQLRGLAVGANPGPLDPPLGPMEDTKRPVFGAEAERIGTRLDEATDEFLKEWRAGGAEG